MDIKQHVLKLIDKYGTNSPYDLCDYLNIIRVKQPMHPDIRGCYQYFRRNKIIYINSLLPEKDQIQVCCHELGHAQRHSKSNVIFWETKTLFIKDRFEIEANSFAAELLISDEDIKQYFGSGYNIEHIAKSLEVDRCFVDLKIKNLCRRG